METVPGRSLRLSPPRRFICDLMHAARHTPIVTFERRMRLAEVVAARKRLPNPPAWVLLYTKAYARVAAHRPELRRAFLPLPRPHLWQADESVASIALERDYKGEPAVFFGTVKTPDKLPLGELASLLAGWKTKPFGEVESFWRMLLYSRLPLLARRFLWWYACSWSGTIKARNFGTFGISLTGSAGATARNLISPLATTLNTGVMHEDGTIDVQLHFDHRVLDGMPAARALAELEECLRTEIVAELHAMADEPVARPA